MGQNQPKRGKILIAISIWTPVHKSRLIFTAGPIWNCENFRPYNFTFQWVFGHINISIFWKLKSEIKKMSEIENNIEVVKEKAKI